VFVVFVLAMLRAGMLIVPLVLVVAAVPRAAGRARDSACFYLVGARMIRAFVKLVIVLDAGRAFLAVSALVHLALVCVVMIHGLVPFGPAFLSLPIGCGVRLASP
jgi:hypothetical protein